MKKKEREREREKKSKMKEKIQRKVIEQSKESREETAGTNGEVENLPDPQGAEVPA